MKRTIKAIPLKKVSYTLAISLGLSVGAFGIASASSNTQTTGSAIASSTVAASQSLPGPGGRGGWHGGPGSMLGGLAGKVSSIGNGSFTISTNNGKSVTVDTTASTTYHEIGVTTQPTSVTLGEQVMVRPTNQDLSSSTTSVTAASVEIIQPTLAGKVISAGQTTIVVQDRQGFYRTIDLSSATQFATGEATASSTDNVTTGENIVAYGSIASDHTSLNATMVDIAVPRYGGTASAVTTSGFTLTTRAGTTYSVVVNSSTTYRGPGATTPTLSSITSGTHVMVEGSLSGSTITASTIGIAPQGGGAHNFNGGFGGPQGQPTTPSGATTA